MSLEISEPIDVTQKPTHFKLIRFIVISAIKLNMNDISLATATTIYHKFYEDLTNIEFDPYVNIYLFYTKKFNFNLNY